MRAPPLLLSSGTVAVRQTKSHVNVKRGWGVKLCV